MIPLDLSTWAQQAVGGSMLLALPVALLAGLVADRFGLAAAVWTVAAITFGSGALAAVRMPETLARHPPR